MKLPATIITGFLGAGKTTLIRHLLENANGKRIALVINEFGDLGIDRDAAEAALTRIVDMVLSAERAVDPETAVELQAILDRLVLQDVYLSQALMAGHGAAWTTFEQLLERAFEALREGGRARVLHHALPLAVQVRHRHMSFSFLVFPILCFPILVFGH